MMHLNPLVIRVHNSKTVTLCIMSSCLSTFSTLGAHLSSMTSLQDVMMTHPTDEAMTA